MVDSSEKRGRGRPPNDFKKEKFIKEEKPKRTIDPNPVGNRVAFDTRNGIHLIGKILWMESNWIVLQVEKGSSIKDGEGKVLLIHGGDMTFAEIL